eukprot:scaffold135313_cov24-Tisochrysis_lutea.AAC.1
MSIQQYTRFNKGVCLQPASGVEADHGAAKGLMLSDLNKSNQGARIYGVHRKRKRKDCQPKKGHEY